MLDKLRQEIDAIDREMVALFEARTKLVEEVAAYKLSQQLEILDAGRESQVIAKVQGYLQSAALKDEIAEFYTTLMRISREHQAAWMAETKK